MTKTILRRHRPDEAALLALATRHAAPAAHLAHSHRDRTVSFDDVAEFDGMPHDWRPGRDAAELDHDAVSSTIRKMRSGTELRADGEPSPADRAALDHLAGPTRGIRTAWLRPVPLANIPTLENLAAETHDAVTGAHRMLDDLAAYATEIRELLAGVTV